MTTSHKSSWKDQDTKVGLPMGRVDSAAIRCEVPTKPREVEARVQPENVSTSLHNSVFIIA